MERKVPFLLVAAVTAVFLSACTDERDNLVGFAQCLSDKKVVMYGAYWCPHCTKQKELFGKKSFANVNYVECDPRGANANPKLCEEKQIKNYPTWEFSDGSRLTGEKSLSFLSEKTGCALPPPPGETGTTIPGV